MSFMPPIETNGISSKQSSHQCGKRDCAGSKKKMGMLCEVLDYVKLNTSNSDPPFIFFTCLLIYYT